MKKEFVYKISFSGNNNKKIMALTGEEYKAFNNLLLTSHKTLKENMKLFTETEIGAKFKLAFEDVFTYYGESVRYVYLGKYLKVDDKIKITIWNKKYFSYICKVKQYYKN